MCENSFFPLWRNTRGHASLQQALVINVCVQSNKDPVIVISEIVRFLVLREVVGMQSSSGYTSLIASYRGTTL